MKISSLIISYTINSIIADMKKRPGNAAIIALSAIPAFEMAVRSIGNLYDMATLQKDYELQYKAGGNLIGVASLTPCALDAFPGARLCGAIGFIFYSLSKGDHRSALISSKVIYSFCNRVLRPAVLKSTKLFLDAVTYIRRNKLKTVFVLAGCCLIYKEYRGLQTVSKTQAIFSKVWSKVKL